MRPSALIATGVSASFALVAYHLWRQAALLRLQNEELLIEARLLAKELSVQLQKGAQKATEISLDPLVPTVSAERAVTKHINIKNAAHAKKHWARVRAS